MKLLLTVLLICAAQLSHAQVGQSEMLGLERGSAFRLFEGGLDYAVVRTDEFGKVVWIMEPEQSDAPIDMSEPAYIVYGYSTVVGNRVVGDPTAYDYWLVKREELVKAEVYPNPTRSEATVFVSKPGEFTRLELYDSSFRLVISQALTDYSTVISLAGLAPGIYAYKITDESDLIKGGKLCVQ